MNAGIVNKVCNSFELYTPLKYTTTKIHIKQDSKNSLILNSIFLFYSMLPNKIAPMELKWRIVCPYSAHKRKEFFSYQSLLTVLLNTGLKCLTQECVYACQNASKNTFLFHILIYTLLRRISVHLIISVNIIMVSLTTLRCIFPFLRNMSLLVIKGMLY